MAVYAVDEVYKFLHSASSATAWSLSSGVGADGSAWSLDKQKESDPPWAVLKHRHEVLLKLPLNEVGEMVSGGRHSMHSLSTNTPRGSPSKHSRQRPRSPPQSPLALDKGDGQCSPPPTPRRHSMNESPSGSTTLNGHGAAQSVDTLQIHETLEDSNISDRDDGDDLLFEMDDDDDDDDEDEDDEDRSFLSTPPSSGYALDAASRLKGIPELHINIVPSADTLRSQESRSLSAVEVIHEDSETDDRVFAVEAPSRKRRNAKLNATKNGGTLPLLSPLKSSQFGLKSSGSLRIKSPFESKVWSTLHLRLSAVWSYAVCSLWSVVSSWLAAML